MPYPGLLHPEPLPLQQSTADPDLHRRHSDTVQSQSLWGLWVLVHMRFPEPSEHLWREWGFILNANFPLLPSCWGFSDLGHGVSPQNCSGTMQLLLQCLMSCWGFSFALGCGVSPHSLSRATHPALHSHGKCIHVHLFQGF